jgi:hypothetical protein
MRTDHDIGHNRGGLIGVHARSAALLVTFAMAVPSLASCNGGGGDRDGGVQPSDAACAHIASSDLDCTPVYDPPELMALYDNILEPRCGNLATGGQCHGPAQEQSGLVLFEPEDARANLLRADHPLVVPGHPECSELMRRLESDDARIRMPLQEPALDDGEICAVRQWIAAGAVGP